MNYLKKISIIYLALTVALIPFIIQKYLEIKQYSGALNEILEGVFIVLLSQIIETIVIYFIIQLSEKIFNIKIKLKYLLPVIILLQLLILQSIIK